MTVSTRDRAKVGRRDWVVTIGSHGRYDDPDADLQHIQTDRLVRRSRRAAERVLLERMPLRARATTWDVTGEIRTGVWVSWNFSDPGFGTVHDAEFEEDDFPCAYADVDPVSGVMSAVEWEES